MLFPSGGFSAFSNQLWHSESSEESWALLGVASVSTILVPENDTILREAGYVVKRAEYEKGTEKAMRAYKAEGQVGTYTVARDVVACRNGDWTLGTNQLRMEEDVQEGPFILASSLISLVSIHSTRVHVFRHSDGQD